MRALKVRVLDLNGQPWFVAADVCRALGLRNTTMAMRSFRTDERGFNRIETPGGRQMLNTISESGLYRMLTRSDKPEARQFQDWVVRDVLPAIRKDGMYVRGEEKVASGELDEDTLILRAMEALQRKVGRLAEEARSGPNALQPHQHRPDPSSSPGPTTSRPDALSGHLTGNLAETEPAPSQLGYHGPDAGRIPLCAQPIRLATQAAVHLGPPPPAPQLGPTGLCGRKGCLGPLRDQARLQLRHGSHLGHEELADRARRDRGEVTEDHPTLT